MCMIGNGRGSGSLVTRLLLIRYFSATAKSTSVKAQATGVGLNVLHKSLYQGIIVSLDLSANREKQSPSQNDAQKLEVKFKSLESQIFEDKYPSSNISFLLIINMLFLARIRSIIDAGFSGGGLLIQSEMQHGPVNMVAGAQNVNGVAVGGLEGYLGNSRFSY
ncbi:unnamed protein product [Lactuca virosa]|uniref:Uncharacterized protein n=1 Tax=Lactuca virosa TaxID=75947 RepID=A0AAU9MYN9_9ASTR|nr:unnamed protein product [Lactuca virosa]